MKQDLAKLFCDPGIFYPCGQPDLAFSDYIVQCKTIIAQTRTDLNTNLAAQIIERNAPFEIIPKQACRGGVLLIHGLFDSPFLMRDIGKVLCEQGFLVRAVLLPGQGTVPGALLNVRYQDWLQTVSYGVHSLAKEVSDVYLVGFSTGASLALYQSLQYKNLIKGVIGLSPAIKIRSAFDFMSHWYRWFLWCSPRAAWLHQDSQETIDAVKYRSVPFNAIYQVFLLAKAIQHYRSDIPLFFGLSRDDETVCSQTAIQFFKSLSNAKNKMLIYAPTPEKQMDSRIITKNCYLPDQHILNFSHSCIPISPDNVYYGRAGEYFYASKAGTPATLFGNFTPLHQKFYQMLYQMHLTPVQHARLTYNPDFLQLTKHIIDFINDLT